VNAGEGGILVRGRDKRCEGKREKLRQRKDNGEKKKEKSSPRWAAESARE